MDKAKKSVYEGLVEDILRNIRLGIIAEGDKLPSCRELALKLGINPNTVQRAYAQLEEEGVIYTVPKKGVYCGVIPLTRITQSPPAPAPLPTIKTAIEELKEGGLGKEEVQNLIGELLGEIFKEDGND